jgi:FixJ family two-component response regulator
VIPGRDCLLHLALLVTDPLNKQIAAKLGTEFTVKSSGGTKDADGSLAELVRMAEKLAIPSVKD